MKLKFRADSKDIVIFVIFCVILLYLCSIAVLNLSEFSKYGTFFGLNPFPAFTSEYIFPTLVIFIFALAAIIMSVSSYFFDREKGIGISTDAKKEKGYSRWCTDKEMKKELKPVLAISETSEFAGIPIMNDGKKIWVDDGEFHTLVIGSTGAGKTEMTIQPMVKVLAKKGESMIITDPKGEIYEKNALELKEKGYNIVLLNFRNPQNGNCWNPLTLPYQLYCDKNQDKACELLEDLALNILYDESSKGQDPFWEKTSADYFAGLSLALFEDAKAEEINLNSINLMTTAGEDKIGNTTYIKEYFSDKDQGSPAYINVASTLMAPNETKSSILSVFKQKIKLFSSRENLSEMLSHSDFDMHDIGRKKTAVFIVIQDEKKTYHSLVTIFLKQCYETLISVAQECGGHLPYRTNFILDEFANMPPLKDVTTMVTAARSRHIKFTFVIQNFAQLYEVYGKENGETIKGNCGNIIYLISSELSALEEISKLCGEVKSKEKDKTDSRPLVTVSDLQRLPQWTLIAIRIRMMPFKTKLTPNWQMVKNNSWGKNYDLATYPVREKGIVQTFNIKQFVDKKKEEKVTNMLNNITGGSSKPVDTGFNPFASQKPSNAPLATKSTGGFDVDEMVRRIDAKIAELEEEERQEKAKLAEKNGNANNLNPTENVIPLVEENRLNTPITSSILPSINKEDAMKEELPVQPKMSLEIPSLEDDDLDLTLNKYSIPTTKPEETKVNLVSDLQQNSDNLLDSLNSADDADDDNDSGKFFGLPVVEPSLVNNTSKKLAAEEVEEETLSKSDNINSQFFDFIVPVEPKEEKQEEKKPVVNVPEENVSIPEGIINDILPVSSVPKQDLTPIDSLPEDSYIEKPVEENVDIPVSTEIKFIQPVINDDLTKKEEIISVNKIPNDSKKEKTIEKNIDKLDAKVINNNYVTDDQFFDDFFNDED